MNADETWAKWGGWLEVIFQQIVEMHHHRVIWKRLCELVEAGGNPHREYFLDPFSRMYVDAQVMAVRRQDDSDQGSISIARLLNGLGNESHVATKERFLAPWGFEAMDPETIPGKLDLGVYGPKAEKIWSWFAHPERPNRFDPAIARKDKQGLDKMVTIVEFATKTVAHPDENPPPEATYGELDRAIDLLGELYIKYSLLLTGSAPSKDGLVPVIPGDWLGPFRLPLL